MTGAGAKRVVEASRKAGKVLGVGHERRWEPAFEELRRMVDAGTLGKLLFFDSHVSHDNFRKLAKDNWRLDPASAPAGDDDRGRHPPHRSLHQHRRPARRGARALHAA